MNILTMGPPGSGKDTLTDKLVARNGFSVINTGALFRDAANRKTELGLMARDTYWGKGILCPDDIVNKITEDYIKSNNLTNNLIFNGYPRSLGQAEYLNKTIHISLAIELTIDKEIAIERLLKRGRDDDKPDLISVRFDEHEKKVEPMLDFYRKLKGCTYHCIDTDHLPEAVYQEVLHTIMDLQC